MQTSVGMYAHTETQTQPKHSCITSTIFQTCLAITNNKKHYLHAQAIHKMCYHVSLFLSYMLIPCSHTHAYM